MHPIPTAPTLDQAGFADAAVELLRELDLDEVVVLGWSLGGHIDTEMTDRLPGMRGPMIAGTPLVGRNDMALGFARAPRAGLAGREHLSEADCEALVHAIVGEAAELWLVRAVARADGRFRKGLFGAAAHAGDGSRPARHRRGQPHADRRRERRWRSHRQPRLHRQRRLSRLMGWMMPSPAGRGHAAFW
jgi:pimeloyl-ACP methyl ester carboxylesterase